MYIKTKSVAFSTFVCYLLVCLQVDCIISCRIRILLGFFTVGRQWFYGWHVQRWLLNIIIKSSTWLISSKEQHARYIFQMIQLRIFELFFYKGLYTMTNLRKCSRIVRLLRRPMCAHASVRCMYFIFVEWLFICFYIICHQTVHLSILY